MKPDLEMIMTSYKKQTPRTVIPVSLDNMAAVDVTMVTVKRHQLLVLGNVSLLSLPHTYLHSNLTSIFFCKK